MSRRFTLVTLALTAVVAFLVGAIFAGGVNRSGIVTGTPKADARPISHIPASPSLVNFADIVERINPAVVNIDSTTQARDSRRRRGRVSPPDPPDPFDGPFDFGNPRPDRDT